MIHSVTLYPEAAAMLASAMDGTLLETAAFGFAGRVRTERLRGLLVDEIELVPDAGYARRTAGSFSLEPRYVAEIALRAEERGRSIVLFHSHPGSGMPTDFSIIDERMHAGLIKSLLRIMSGPVGSIVRSGHHWNGRLWEDAGNERRLDEVRILGEQLGSYQIGAAFKQEDPRWDRQVRAFGPHVQERLGRLRLAVVGAGGTGSLMLQGVAHLGVRDIVIVDPDRLDVSNTSRLVGSRAADLCQTPAPRKVEIARRLVNEIAPEARVRPIPADITDCEVLRQLRDCDLVVACTDSHSSRDVLNVFAYQYGVALLDLGTVIKAENGRVRGAYADLRVAGPGFPCLRCQGVIDYERVHDEMLSPAERLELERAGYLPGNPTPAPSVLPLNALAVSLAQLRLLDLLEPWLGWPARITVETRGLSVFERSATSDPGCDVCGDHRRWGRGDDLALHCRNRAREHNGGSK